MKLLSLLQRAVVPAACNLALLLLGTPTASAEAPDPGVSEQEISIETLNLEVNETRQRRTSRGMGVLLGWSVLNMGTGAVGYFTTDGATRYFHQMNAAWNAVNALIAGFGLANARREDPTQFDSLQTLEEGRRLEKILLFNMGLNVAYMSAGAYLWERGRRIDDDRLRGYGPSLIVQGGFLLIFDSTLFTLQNRASNAYVDDLRMHWNDGPFLSYQKRF